LSTREITDLFFSYLNTTLEAVANFKPDIIHANHFSLISWIARYIYALEKVKYLITSHGSDLYTILADKRYMPLCEDSLRKSKFMTVVSTDSRTKLVKSFRPIYKNKAQRNSIKIIPGAIDIAAFPENIDSSYLDEKYDIRGKQIVLFTGRLISQKGAKYLVKAAKDIKAEVFIIGDGPEKEKLAEEISQKGLANVHLIGYLQGKELRDFYYRADIFVAPSVWDEPLGLSILEAMAAKCAVITTRKGGIPLLIKDGVNGFFVHPRNSFQIAQVCNKLLESAELREKIGRAARKTVLEKFTWKKTALKFHRLYGEICGNGTKKECPAAATSIK